MIMFFKIWVFGAFNAAVWPMDDMTQASETERQTETERDRETGQGTERQTDRQRDT